MYKFKKGDKVSVVSDSEGNFTPGEIVIVTENDDVPYCRNSDGKVWAMDEKELELVKPKFSLFKYFLGFHLSDIQHLNETVFGHWFDTGIKYDLERSMEVIEMLDERVSKLEKSKTGSKSVKKNKAKKSK